MLPGMDFTLPQDRISIMAHATGLWLWSSLNGIWHRDWDTGKVTHHESKSGLPTDQVSCAADFAGTIYFGGGKMTGVLFAWDAVTRGWRLIPRPAQKQEESTAGMRLTPFGDELFMQAFPSFVAWNGKAKTWRDLTGYMLRNGFHPWESLATSQALWSWDPKGFARIDLATMTNRPVTPAGDGLAVIGTPCFFAETDGFVWAVARDGLSDFDHTLGNNIHRLFAVKKSEGTVQDAILLPMACRIQCGVVVDKTLWLGVARGQPSSQSVEGLPCLIRVPLPH